MAGSKAFDFLCTFMGYPSEASMKFGRNSTTEKSELCDCLVVCGPHGVIISVKDNKYRATDDATGWERWTKAAIEKSASQIWGAERWLESADKVERHDGR